MATDTLFGAGGGGGRGNEKEENLPCAVHNAP